MKNDGNIEMNQLWANVLLFNDIITLLNRNRQEPVIHLNIL